MLLLPSPLSNVRSVDASQVLCGVYILTCFSAHLWCAFHHHQVLVELGAEAGADVVRVQLDEQQRIVYEVLPTCSCERCKVWWRTNATLPLFAWSHVAVVQQDDGQVQVYVNASLTLTIFSSPSSATRRPVARTVERSNRIVGASLAQPELHNVFNGKILDLAIWNTSVHMPLSPQICHLTDSTNHIGYVGVILVGEVFVVLQGGSGVSG